MGCGSSFVKYALFFFNLLVALVGLVLLGFGVAMLLHLKEVTDIVPSKWQIAPWILVIIGSAIFIIAFFGCCGAVREGHCMLVSYAVFLLLIVVIQVAVAALVLVYVDDSDSYVNQFVQNAFDKAQGNSGHGGSDTKLAREAFNALETSFHCCGTHGASSYGAAPLSNSCCSDEKGILQQLTGACTIVESTSREGCVEALTTFMKSKGKLSAWIAIGIAAIELIGAISALCLANTIRNMERRYA